MADAVQQLNDLKAAGIDTIFDPTVLGLGRYIPRIQKGRDADRSQHRGGRRALHLQCLPHQFEHRGPGLSFDQPEPLVEMFVKDITEGILDTGVKAAFLKCAIEEAGLTPGVERVMRAVGQTSVRTGAPVTVHTNPHTGSVSSRSRCSSRRVST